MYRAIHSVRPLRRHWPLCQTAWLSPLLQACRTSTRRHTTSSAPCPPVDQSFSANHVAKDGRTFRFATVVVRSMKEGDSPLGAWAHACSLIGPGSATLAVAFISKPTKSALHAVQEIASQLSNCKGKPLSPPPPQPPSSVSKLDYSVALSGYTCRQTISPQCCSIDSTNPQKTTVTWGTQKSCESSYPLLHNTNPWSTFPTAVIARHFDSSANCSSSTLGAPVGGSPTVGADFAEIVPFIGCVAEGLGEKFGEKFGWDCQSMGAVHESQSKKHSHLNGGSPASSAHSMERDLHCRSDIITSYAGAIKTPVSEVGASGRLTAAVVGVEGVCQIPVEGFSLGAQGRAICDATQLGFKLAPLRGFSGKGDTRHDDKSIRSDSAGICANHLELKGKRMGSRDCHEKTKVESRGIPGAEVDGRQVTLAIVKQFVVDNLKELPDPTLVDDLNNNLSLPRRQGEETILECDQRHDFTAVIGGGGGAPSRHTAIGERELIIPLKEVVEAPDAGSNSGTDEDEKYTMVLCVGHMPGTQAVAFVSPTTGMPYLPNIERAVTVNNPHILMLGAPGFGFPEFNQRLSTVFPESCRAGAFQAPLFGTIRNPGTRLAEQKSRPLFYGTHSITKGVVGLAVSSEEGAGEVPVDAFAQFVRMSLGMPRISGYTFLDEDVSASLFLPRNMVLDKMQLQSERRTTRSIMAILDQLSSYLLQVSCVPDGNNALPQKIPDERKIDGKEALSFEEALTSVSLPRADAHTPIGGDQSKNEGRPMPFISPQSGIVKDRGLEGKESGRSSQPAVGGSGAFARVPPVCDQSGDSEIVPLALFDCVLFPGWSMPFHIYEPCYHLMVRQCVEQGKPFGLLSMCTTSWNSSDADKEEVIGTVANLKVYMFQRDCQSFIIGRGIRRFRLRDKRMVLQPCSFGLNMGQVEYFDDEPCASQRDQDLLLDLAKRVVDMCKLLVPEAQVAPGLVGSFHNPVLASFAVGHLLQVPNRVKKRWLGMVSTKYRLVEQLQFLEAQALMKDFFDQGP